MQPTKLAVMNKLGTPISDNGIKTFRAELPTLATNIFTDMAEPIL
jgi:hypothetical protein